MPAFDEWADYCRLNNKIKYEKSPFTHNGNTYYNKIYSPIDKCVKPKTIKEFVRMANSYK